MNVFVEFLGGVAIEGPMTQLAVLDGAPDTWACQIVCEGLPQLIEVSPSNRPNERHVATLPSWPVLMSQYWLGKHENTTPPPPTTSAEGYPDGFIVLLAAGELDAESGRVKGPAIVVFLSHLPPDRKGGMPRWRTRVEYVDRETGSADAWPASDKC